jgi:ABC-type transport system involved in multi-copper enzyme maturation permease subunit
VNRELIVAFLRQRLASVMRVSLLALNFFFPVLIFLFIPGSPISLLAQNAMNFALILSAGMIGQDVSAGVLQLVFARPVRRSEYVFSRWGAAGLGAAAMMILQVATVAAIAALRGHPQPLGDLGTFTAEALLHAIGVVSVMALLSALAPGLADLALLLIAMFSGTVLSTVGQVVHNGQYLVRTGEEIGRFASPELALAPLFHGDAVSWFAIASYLSTVTLCLALAIVVVNRKELSYASG